MPNDVYRWEEGGALVHHCPMCQTPLSHEQCRSKCLAKHVEWCSRYHTQLFKIGCSGECRACRQSEEMHDVHHREIAQLVQKLGELKATHTPQVNRTLASRGPDPTTPSPLSKKERKAAKNAAKNAERPKVVSLADVEFIANALHPCDYEKDEADEEKRLIADPDIKLNLYYHKGTSNTREMRHRHLEGKQAERGDSAIADSELDVVMKALNVSAPNNTKSDAERRLVTTIREKVHDDLITAQHEHEQTIIRKAGFWRWASRKAYNRLVANGRLWDQKHEGDEGQRRKDSAVFSAAPDGLISDVPSLTGEAKSHVEPRVTKRGEVSLSVGSGKRSTSQVDEEWTTVGKVKTPSTPVGPFKMVGNGGLAKLQVKMPGKFAQLGLMASEEEDEEDEEEKEESVDLEVWEEYDGIRWSVVGPSK